MSVAIEKSPFRFLTLISTALNLTVRNDQKKNDETKNLRHAP